MDVHNFRTGAGIPGVQAALSGVFASLVVAGVCLVRRDGYAYILVTGAGVACLVWVWRLRHWVTLANFQAGIQPVQPVEVIQPTYQPTTRIELVERSGGATRGEYLNLPATPAQLRLVACAVTQGGSLSENAWCGADRPFSKSQFHALRQELIERGWLAWRSSGAPAQGVTVTNVGRRVFAYISQGNSLLPTNQGDEE